MSTLSKDLRLLSSDVGALKGDLSSVKGEVAGLQWDLEALANCVNRYMDTIGRWSSDPYTIFTYYYC